jgi:Na+/melibiose symporter-like transporter
MQAMASLAWVIATTVMLNYTQIVLAFGTLEYVLAGATLLLGIVFFMFIWRKIIAKRGKKGGLLILFITAALIFSCSVLGIVPVSLALIFGLLFIAGIAFSLAGWFLISGIWYADLAEDDEKKTADLKAGLYVGFPSIALNLFQALGTFILGLITSLPKIAVGTLMFSCGYLLWGPICAVFLILTYFYAKRFIRLDFEWEKVPRQ